MIQKIKTWFKDEWNWKSSALVGIFLGITSISIVIATTVGSLSPEVEHLILKHSFDTGLTDTDGSILVTPDGITVFNSFGLEIVTVHTLDELRGTNIRAGVYIVTFSNAKTVKFNE